MKRRLGPDGIHLFDRSTGLNVLFDEVTVPRQAWSVAPRQVSVALTNSCDLSCAYCYAPKHRAQLVPEELCRWLDELDDAGCLGVGFGGGEPILYRHLAHVCIHAAERTGLAVTITTHGHRWDADVVARLKGAVDFVRVSVDGVGATYERLRRRSFRILRERLNLIAGAFPIGINCVVNADTVAELSAVASLAAEYDARELLLLPERATGRSSGVGDEVLSRMEKWVRTYPGPVRLAVSEGVSGEVPVAVPLPQEFGLRSYAHIDASGTARPTSYSAVGERINEDGVMKALHRLSIAGAA